MDAGDSAVLGFSRQHLEVTRVISTIYRGAHGRWRDIVLVLILATIAGLAAYQGTHLIDPVAFNCQKESTWFSADLSIAFRKMSDRFSVQYNGNTHPLFSVATFPPVYVLKRVFGIGPISAVRIVLAGIASLWVSAVFILLRLMCCRRFDATLFTILAMTSAAAVFWLVVPETFALGSVSITLALVVVTLAQRKKVSDFWYVVVSGLTLGFTVTNWMAGVIATFVNHSWKRTMQISVNALCGVLVLWDIKKYLFPVWPSYEFFFFFVPQRAASVLASTAGGPVHSVKTFVFHTMIMPAIQVSDKYSRPDDWPLMLVQLSGPGSASLWGAAGVVLWAVLLGLGLWALVSIGEQRELRLAVGLMVLGQLALHTVYNEAVFTHSLHFGPLLIALAALSTLTRARPAVLVLAAALVLCAAINNTLQFVEATESLQCIIGKI